MKPYAASALWILVLGGALPSPAETAAPDRGVVIREVPTGGSGERAGFLPGDVILSWSRAASGGSIESPLELLLLDHEEVPRGGVTLHGERGGRPMSWLLPRYPLDFVARSEGETAAWLLFDRANAAAVAQRWPEVDAAFLESIAAVPADAPIAGLLWFRWGETFRARSDWAAAEERYRRAVDLFRARDPQSLAAAAVLLELGVLAEKQTGFALAEERFREVLALQEELAPGSSALAETLMAAGVVAREQGDLAGAEAFYERGLEIEQGLRPESFVLTGLLTDLGILAASQGDLALAEERFVRALGMERKLGAGDFDLASSYLNLGFVAGMRGDLARAEERMAEALILFEKAAPEGVERAATLAGLGDLALQREDWETAGLYQTRALALREKVAPESEDVARSVEALGLLAERRGDLAAAERHYRRALELYARAAPEGFELARMGSRLADLARQRGDLAAAEREIGLALGNLEPRLPGSLLVAELAAQAGDIASRRGDLATAERRLRQAITTEDRLAPESTAAADSWYRLGTVLWRSGRREEGAEALCRAVDRLEGQRAQLGGSAEVRGGFGARHQAVFGGCLAAQVDLGRIEAAFQTLERGRARGFLELLAERDLVLASGLPPAVERERRRLGAELDGLQAGPAPLRPGRDDEEMAEIAGRMAEIRRRQSEIVAELHRSSPRFASLQYPQPLDLAAARAALDPGTVLLAYALGEERSFLFVVQPAGEPGPGLAVVPLAVGAAELREKVGSLRALLRQPQTGRSALRHRAAALYDLLVRPAEGRLRHAERLLISPDGALHELPFAALLRHRRPLIEWKPLHTVLSATVYAEIQKAPRSAAEGAVELVAFGDPAYPAAVAAEAEVRAAVERGLDLAPLPHTRDEVRGLAALFPGAHTFVGVEATEERAKQEAPRARRLHFACHAFLDRRFPLQSGLALSLPGAPAEGRDNGLLQAWEIFEQVRVEADLVTLSACDTALGQEVGGEGLIGLTRAFQYAGARSVLATLWSVSDEATAGLMQRFYTGLRAGLPKDEALRAAQRHLARPGAHPYYWAAFQLSGGWR